MEKISKVFMVKYIDPGTGQEYFLNADDRKALTGYYFTSDPYPAMLFCATTGRWFEWKPDLQEWQREQEWCRVYYDNNKELIKIQALEGFPSPDSAVRKDTEITKERVKSWKEWHSRYDSEGTYYDVTFYRDGSCEIQEISVTTEPIWDRIVRSYYTWKLDAENTKKILSITDFDAIDVNDLNTVNQKQAFLKRLYKLKEKYENYSDLFKRLEVSFTFNKN